MEEILKMDKFTKVYLQIINECDQTQIEETSAWVGAGLGAILGLVIPGAGIISGTIVGTIGVKLYDALMNYIKEKQLSDEDKKKVEELAQIAKDGKFTKEQEDELVEINKKYE